MQKTSFASVNSLADTMTADHPAQYEIGDSVVVETIVHGSHHGTVSDREWLFNEWLFTIELTDRQMRARPWDMERV